MQKHKNYLGIDWGSAKVGLALAHHETNIALGYDIFQNNQMLLPSLGSVIETEEIGTVIIGVPKHLNRDQDDFGGRLLGKELTKRFGVMVVYQDEMFTTKMAQANLIERGGKDISQTDDQEAARIILETWLEKQ